MTDQIGTETVELIQKHLPDSLEPTMLVLKAHLLVEEQLVKFLEAIASDAKHIPAAKLSFPQRVQMLQAFLPISVPEEWFKAALLLNTIRNKLAHQLTPSDLQHMERDFTKHVFDSSLGLSKFVVLPGETAQEKFKTALATLVIGLSAARSALPTILAAKMTIGGAV